MAVNVKNDVPVGGGLGNMKVIVASLDGTYEVGGFDLLPKEPKFAMADKGFMVVFDEETKKTILKDTDEIAADTDVTGVKIFAIL